jgi:hypothetical protein
MLQCGGILTLTMKVSLYTSVAPRLKANVEWRYSSTHSYRWQDFEAIGHFTLLALYPRGKSLSFPLSLGMEGSQKGTWCLG